MYVSIVGGVKQQTCPPSIPICELYPDENFPEGEILEHPIAAVEWVNNFISNHGLVITLYLIMA